MRRVGFFTKTAVETAAISGGWYGENKMIPVSTLISATVSLEANKIVAICPVSKELLRVNPANEGEIVNVISKGTAKYQDQQFLDPTVNKSATVNPPSITSNLLGYVSQEHRTHSLQPMFSVCSRHSADGARRSGLAVQG